MLTPDINHWATEISARWQKIPELIITDQIKHLAIICDGDRRAAQVRGFKPYLGHQAGLEVVKGITESCFSWGINTLTFWLWSTENWGRESEQIDFAFKLAKEYLFDENILEGLTKNQIRFTHLGRKDRLPKEIEHGLNKLESSTKLFRKNRLNFAIDYGGEDELSRAVIKAFTDAKENPSINLEANPLFLLNYLDTAGQSNVDLVIRTGITSNEIPHTSGFMPLQTSFASWIFVEELFPDLTPETLQKSIVKAGQYQKRLGR